ncbi:hypothetical protein IEQ34_024605 [Dendrobium chrysotoxum]|uniref:Uncharacterized protein n=1 Tax=Dendrobium chrysotoxum TaxID=161865 RepID=A0AAV7FT60_DENCH|nr:hypothetical protein IEQ34_024605 [Dendrobium chrysotoxum]
MSRTMAFLHLGFTRKRMPGSISFITAIMRIQLSSRFARAIASLRNRERSLQNQEFSFRKGERAILNRRLSFEARDLLIREERKVCYSLFNQVLSEDPALAEKDCK